LILICPCVAASTSRAKVRSGTAQALFSGAAVASLSTVGAPSARAGPAAASGASMKTPRMVRVLSMCLPLIVFRRPLLRPIVRQELGHPSQHFGWHQLRIDRGARQPRRLEELVTEAGVDGNPLDPLALEQPAEQLRVLRPPHVLEQRRQPRPGGPHHL